ncbi:hypothetical protein KIPB_011926, partial [Kipferlia bialata]|eukprot:g11926.t1
MDSSHLFVRAGDVAGEIDELLDRQVSLTRSAAQRVSGMDGTVTKALASIRRTMDSGNRLINDTERASVKKKKDLGEDASGVELFQDQFPKGQTGGY